MDDDLDAEQDALDDARAAVTDLAEKALLGGLLLRQRTRDDVRDWLAPEHFRSWTHGAVYQAFLDLDDAPEGGDADPNRPRAVAERTVSAPAATPQYVSSLAGACPRFDHVPQYARLVVRAALRRSVTEDAARLARAAARTDADDPDAQRVLVHQTDAVRESAAALAHGQTLSADVLSDLDRPTDRERRSASEGYAPARTVADRAAVPMTEALLRETELVAAILRSPGALDEGAVRRLSPQTFTDPTCGALFAAARALAGRGEALDELLVVAEADTVGPWTAEFGPLEARDLLAVSAGGDAGHLAALVLGHAAKEQAVQVAAGAAATARGASVRTETDAERAGRPAEQSRDSGAAGGDGGEARRPVVVFVAGEAVAASATAVLVHDVLSRHGRVPVELGRGFPPDHPLREVVAGAPDAAARYEAAEQHVRARALDAVVHTRAADPDRLAAAMRRFREAGYRVELAGVAVSEPRRHLAALDAHVRRGAGGPPPVLAAERLAETLALVEEQALTDTVSVLRSDTVALYVHQAAADSQRGPQGARAAEAVAGELGRPWTFEESVRFSADYARVAARCGTAEEQALRTVADLADRQHADQRWRVAAALAEQALAAAPRADARPGERIEAAGPAGTLTEAALDGELVQTLRNLSLVRSARTRAQERAARRLRSAGPAGPAGGPGGLAARSAAEDAAYYVEEAHRMQARSEGLMHRYAALVREINRRSQLTARQRAQEDWLRSGRASSRARAAVDAVRERGLRPDRGGAAVRGPAGRGGRPGDRRAA